MPADTIDLRSDTVTRPGREMRRAMADAEVGDDVYGEDPTINRLEEVAAETLGMGRALFVPSGTMGNQIAIAVHTEPGNDVIVESGSHVYHYELGAMAVCSGAVPRVLHGDRGILDPEDVARAVSPPIYYMATTALLVLENTHNHCGGSVLPMARKDALLATARSHRLAAHLDGARIFNAAVALERPARDLAAGFDSVMFCLSKGLGAPVGSLLCGSADFIREARIVRKRLGGGMRQAGVLAAAGLVGLKANVDRLNEDHRRARLIADAIAGLPALDLDPPATETNIVTARVNPPATVDTMLDALRARGVLAGPMGPGRLRFVTHLDIDDADVARATAVLREVAVF